MSNYADGPNTHASSQASNHPQPKGNKQGEGTQTHTDQLGAQNGHQWRQVSLRGYCVCEVFDEV